MTTRKLVERILPPLAADLVRPWVRKDCDEAVFRAYLRKREPYSRGYRIYVQRLVVRNLNDGGLVESFRRGAPLRDGAVAARGVACVRIVKQSGHHR